MPREVRDAEGTAWSCVQAYAGLSDGEENDAEREQAAAVEGAPELRHVVCTPTGGAQTVRLALPVNWEDCLSDEELAGAIQAGRK